MCIRDRLVLDEPTNDLDIDTLELLEYLLQKYDGTVFLVSHDRTFLDNVVTSTIAFEGEGRWREYEGGVEDWLVQSARTAAIQNASKSGAIKDQAMLGTSQKDPQAAAKATPAPAKLSYKDQRELDALPGRIEALEKEQQALRLSLIHISEPTRPY